MAAMIDPRAIVIVAVGLMLVVAAIFLWQLYQKWKAKQRAQALSNQLNENSSSAPSSISDPARRAKLDDLRQNFSKGVEKFRAAGKDLYSLPWYVVCGEPGSGKTEAVRHCNVGFPPGLQDEMQGAGGTLNMHWWFTNQAVLLDTAGKLLFQEALPGTTNEWTEFLNLLRKTRPDCPINGLLLVIPVESLIKDPFEDIQRKAGKIAQQLDVIQKRLDVRFPVFVLITKCDLINGFREFFAGLKDPQLQHQMTGWSNGESLDAPFRPDAVDQHLDHVVQRIRRRRLGLLKDPIPTEPVPAGSTSALFTLPGSIAACTAPAALPETLRRERMVRQTAVSPRHLFHVRLDRGLRPRRQLASALGLAPEALPDGKAWGAGAFLFLRDLFTQKIFKEQGLVTRATNTGQLVRRRQWILASVVGCGLLGLVVLSLIGRNALRSSVGEELACGAPGRTDRMGGTPLASHCGYLARLRRQRSGADRGATGSGR
jgi:type VI protein secretion system component VasK